MHLPINVYCHIHLADKYSCIGYTCEYKILKSVLSSQDNQLQICTKSCHLFYSSLVQLDVFIFTSVTLVLVSSLLYL